jgi:LCP family protein required for cell wall assembly
MMIVLASAAGSAALAFNELDKLVNALGYGPKLDLGESLAQAEAGQPQTIMLLGSDERADTPETEPGEFGDPRSDTVILVRLDPSKGATALMSLPRDLKVDIPGRGEGKLNDAYSYGGPKLVVDTVKKLTGLRINHVINVDFGGFIKIVDRLGCVYTDVDRSYQSSGIEYAYINIDAGYQKLCGDDALAYVRFRHEDNDLIRGARQQEFLRQAKEQFTAGELFADRDRLLQIFGEYTESDIDSREDTLQLLKLALASLDEPVREVHFEGTIGETFVTASHNQVRRLTEDFLGVRDTEGPRSGDANGGSGSGSGGSGGGGEGDEASDEPELADASVGGRDQAAQAEAKNVGLPVFYPTRMTAGTTFPEEPSVYGIDVGGEQKDAPAYRIVMHSGVLGEYYGIQGTTWRDAPILARPTTTRDIDGVDYELHYDGDRLRMVAWETKDGAYWVSNTLLQSLSEEEMLGIATSAREL